MTAAHVYLVRHARAEATSPAGDAGRALSAEGRAAFEALVCALAPELLVTRVLASPYLRARQTAAILGSLLDAPVEDEPALGSGESEAREVLRLAARLGPGAALVGHNPELAAAVATAAGRAVELPPGGIVALEPAGGALRVVWVRVP